MKNIFKFLSKARLSAAIIALLLIVQAYCDLSLPSYTSDLLNIGLQQGGIEDAVPETVRPESLELLKLFMPDADAETVEAAYGQPRDGLRRLKADAGREALDSIFRIPEVAVLQLSSTPEGQEMLGRFMAGAADGTMTKDDIRQQVSGIVSQIEGLTDMYLEQVAVVYVSAELRAQGADMDGIRNAYLLWVGGYMLVMALVMALISVATGFIAARASASIGRDLRERLYTKVMGFTNAEIEKFSTASLITRCTNDIQQVQMFMVILLRMVAYAPILAVAGIIKVIGTSSGMSWIIVAAVIALAITLGGLFIAAYPKFRIMQQLVDRLNLVSRELLTGVMPIRAFVRQKHEEARFDGANTQLMRTQLFVNRIMAFMDPVLMLVMNGVSVLIVWVGGHGVDAGTIQVGDLTAFITYSMVIIMSFLMMSMVSIMLPRAGVAADRIQEVLDTEITLTDPAEPRDAQLSRGGVLEFDDVSFSYPGADDPVLEHISFTAGPGKTTAIIGSTGCGKSTLIHLIPRFYDVTGGKITLDGVDIRDISQKRLRDLVGYVPQRGILFSGTIESNLKYAGEAVTDGDMREAADIAQATQFIEAKEEGWQSPIAQNGTNVSGGQRQRLSIARAIAKHPGIFLFDDTFSALDYRTDAALRGALARHVAGATVIIVAQRISTILGADQILVMEDGRIVGRGTHRELLKTCETYMEIARGQMSEAEIESALKGEDSNG